LLRAGDKLAARMVMRSDAQFAQSARLAELDEKVSVTLLLFWGVWHWVADPGCLLGIRIFFHPGFRIQQKKRREFISLIVLPFSVAINFIKVKLISFLTAVHKIVESVGMEFLPFAIFG
jgi:hypothetical protein